MKRLALILFAAVLLLSGCQAQEEPLLDSGKLRAVVTSELENSQEIAEYIANGLEVPLEMIRADRNTALDMLSNGSADIAIGSFSQSNDPGLDYRMTLPIAENKIYIVCGGDLTVTSQYELTGKIAGASAELPDRILRSLSNTVADGNLICDNAETAAGLLGSGDINAYVCFEDEALELISQNKELRCCIPADIDSERYSVLVLNSNTDLYSAVNSVIGEMITGDK